MLNLKERASVKITKSLKQYLAQVKPRQNKNCPEKILVKISELIFGMVLGQSCFLNTIAENTPHFAQKKEKGRSLGKSAQIEKLSKYLLFSHYNRFTSSFLNYLQKLFQEDFPHHKKSIKQRVYEKKLALHDTTDIQKPHARKMDNLCTCRDGSRSSAKQTKTGKGYLIEGCGGYWKGRFYPFLLNLYSYVEEGFLSEKKEVEANLEKLKLHKLADSFLHVFDRGYDAASFMTYCLKNSFTFLIRATLKRNVILQSEYAEAIRDCKTQKEKESIFYPLEKICNKLIFRNHADYHWFSIAWAKIYIRGENYPKNPHDVLPVTLISVCLNEEKKEGLEEDIFEKKEQRGEREIHFYTTESVESIEDAIVLFLCYLQRWKIEMYFRFLKQVFGLEEIRLQKFEKIKKLIALLPIATNFLYGKFNEFQQIEEQRQTFFLKTILRKDKTKRTEALIEQELLFFWYKNFCREKGLTENADSFAKAIFELAGNKVDLVINYDFYDSG